MSTKRVWANGLLAAVITTTSAAISLAQHHHRHEDTCAEGQHRSGTHCCNPGEAWVDEREACVCLDPNGCAPPPPPPPPPTPAPAAVPTGCPEGMVSVPGGSFVMGSPSGDGDASEQPQHRVTVAPYCISRTEVTVGQYRSCAQAGTCTAAYLDVNLPGLAPADRQRFSGFCNGGRTDRDNHPINCVDWTQADAYCRAQHGRLPTEAEWEFAARGTEGRAYPWGSAAPARELLNACDGDCRSLMEQPGRPAAPVMFDGSDNYGNTAPVGSYQAGASPFGVMDLAGNVMEWTADWFGPYVPGPATDPTGAGSGPNRVVRGGSWISNNPDTVRGAYRASTGSANRLATLGFRCVQRPEPVAAPPPPAATQPTSPRGRHGH